MPSTKFIEALPLDAGRLMQGMEQALTREILPALAEGRARQMAEAAVEVIRRKRTVGAEPGAGVPADTVAGEYRVLAAFEAAYGANSLPPPAPPDSEGPPDQERLTAWLRERFPQDPQVAARNVVRLRGGFSKQTVFFEKVAGDGRVEPLVLRRDIPLGHVDTTVRDEYPWLKALFAAGLPVPEPVLLEENSAAISGRFLVTRRVAGGNIGSHISVRQDTGFNPARLLAQVKAQLHSFPLDRLDLAALPEGVFDRTAMIRRVTYWRDRYHQFMEVRSAALDTAFDWLIRHVEQGLQGPAVVHGETGFHNMLFDGPRISAMLDWEFVHVGNPAWDLLSLREHVAPFGSFEDFLEDYAEAGGTVPDQASFDYYDIFWLARTGVLCLTAVTLFNRGEHDMLDYVQVSWRLYPMMMRKLCDALAKVGAV